jgi:tape measure domain-containing protein
MKQIQKTGDKEKLMKITIDVSQAQAKLKDLQQVMSETDKKLGGMKQGFSQIGGYIKSAFGIAAVISFTKYVFWLTSEVQSLRKSFTTLTGSIEWSNKMLADIDSFAKKTPFSKLEIAKNAQLLMGFWFQAKQVLPTLQAIGNAVSAMWGSQDQMNGVVLAIGQIYTKGKVSAQEMMQLAERGIPAWDILAKWLNKTVAETQKIVENGWVSAGKGLAIILSGFQEKFNGSLEAQSQTLAGKWSNVMDSIAQKTSEFGTSITDIFGWAIDAIWAIFDSLAPVVFTVLWDILNGFMGLLWGVQDILYGITGTTAEEVEKQWGFWHTLGIFLLALWTGIRTMFVSVFADIGMIITTSISNAWIIMQNFGSNIWVIGQTIATSFSMAFQNALKSVEEFINAAITRFNSLMSYLPESMRFTIGAVSFAGWVTDYGSTIGQLKGLTDGTKAYSFELSNLSANIKAAAQGNGLTDMLLGNKSKREYDLNTLDGMWKKINSLKKELGWLTVGTADYIKKKRELDDLTKKQNSAFWFNGGAGGGWSGGSGSWAKKSKEETEALKKSVDRVKDSYTVLKNELDKVQKTSEKAAIAEKKWAETIKDAHAAVEQQLKKVRTEYEKTIETINKDSSKSTTDAVGSQYRSLLEATKEEEKKLKEAQNTYDAGIAGRDVDWATAYTQKLESEKNIAELKKQTEELLNSWLLSQNTKAKEDQRVTLDEKWQSRFDFQDKLWEIQLEKANKISAATDEFAAKRALALKNESIIKIFENQKSARGIKLDNLKKQLDLQNQDKEQQDLIQKLYDERVSLQKAEDEKKAVETRVFRYTNDLAKEYHTAELAMISERKAEYDALIEKIKAAIAAADSLARAQSSVGISSGSSKKWFADGWYTGDGGKYDEAGVVHKWEYVIPQHVMDSVKHIQPNILPTLERLRTWQRAMAASSQSINNSKSINLTAPIYVERPIDLQREFSKMMWRGF